MKKTIIGMFLLTGCTYTQAFAPQATAKAVVLTKAGLAGYCQIPLSERLAVRRSIDTDQRGGAIWCNDAERQVLFGTEQSYTATMGK